MEMGPEDLQEFEVDTQRGKYLTFMLDKELYAIEIKFVTEIVGIQPITEIPELPSYVKGIINLRGKIITVMDMRLRFRKKPLEYNDRTCVVVIMVDDTPLGLVVDNVSEVLSIEDENIIPPPDMYSGLENRYLKGIGKAENDIKLILDCNKLIRNDEIDLISNIA